MFDTLATAFGTAFNSIVGQKKLTEKNVEDGIRAVRQALLEADVNFQVAKDFVADVRSRVVGQKVIESEETNYGFNALTRTYENLLECGVIVPTKVERVALQNAASISGLLLTTDCAITELKETKDTPASGGMPEMDF